MIADMYKDCTTSVVTNDGPDEIKVGMHQWSAFGPFLFEASISVVREEISEDILFYW